MAEIADEDWIHPIPRSAFSLYPQALDIKQVVADIRKGRPVPELNARIFQSGQNAGFISDGLLKLLVACVCKSSAKLVRGNF
ncbi:hypothetical protein SprV_0702375300 [Sparganum proliferum]